VSVCLECAHICGESASTDYPYPWIWCAKGHWEGGDPEAAQNPDPWEGCPDYEPKPQEVER